jgi:hypothetical protein
MADENKKPWYKDPRYLGLIIAIVAIVVTIIIWLWPIPPPTPSDFSISINPMLGAIQAGGVIQTTVSVMGISGYDHTVSLSVTGQPSGVVLAFVPPFGEAKPSYTSSVTINVDKNVPADDYTLVIKGTGADGKEHSCNYILTVRGKEVTSTPTPTLTPTPTVKITSPKEGDEVPLNVGVSGTISGELPEGQYMWIVVNPHAGPGQWWPQGGRIDPWKGQWYGQARIGSEDAGIGEKFDIAAILVDEKDDQYYLKYLETGQRTGSYPGIPLPPSAKIMDRITVVRI